MTYKDRTFCASPNCHGKCGRKMTEAEMRESAGWLVSVAELCDENGEVIQPMPSDNL